MDNCKCEEPKFDCGLCNRQVVRDHLSRSRYGSEHRRGLVYQEQSTDILEGVSSESRAGVGRIECRIWPEQSRWHIRTSIRRFLERPPLYEKFYSLETLPRLA